MRLPAMITAITAEVGRRGRSRTAVCVQHRELLRPAPRGSFSTISKSPNGLIHTRAMTQRRPWIQFPRAPDRPSTARNGGEGVSSRSRSACADGRPEHPSKVTRKPPGGLKAASGGGGRQGNEQDQGTACASANRLSACGRALRPWLGRTLLPAAVLDPSGQASPAERHAAAMPNGRCKVHGGKSTGPRTPEGLERSRRANWKHGHFSREAKAERSRVRADKRWWRATR
jgi:hypothetical protein